MKTITLFAAIMSALNLVRLGKRFDPFLTILLIPKVIAGNLSPVWAAIGAIGALYGLLRKRPLTVLAGLVATVISGRHIRQVTQSQDQLFVNAFGPDWQARIPADRLARMLPARYQPILTDPLVGYNRENDLVFGHWPGTGEPLLCDLWSPPRGVAPSGRGIIYLHGSAWHFMDKDVGTRPFFRRLVSQGHVVMDVAYTMAPRVDLFGMLGDVKRAIAWLKANGSVYGVDPAQIILMGGSAGGHLTLLAGYTPNLPALQPAGLEADTSVRAVICYYGYGDLAEAYYHFAEHRERSDPKTLARLDETFRRLENIMHQIRLLPAYGRWSMPEEWLPAIFGGTPDKVPENYKLGSPEHYACPTCPPTLFVQGAHDLGGMVNQIRRLHQKLQANGVPAIYLEFPETEHAFDLIFPHIAPATQTATYYVERFLALV